MENQRYGVFFFAYHCGGAPHELDLPQHNNFSLDGIDRNFGSRDRKMDSSRALESYGSLLSKRAVARNNRMITRDVTA